MNRRQYLTVTGAAVAGISAGCVGEDNEEPSSDGGSADRPDSDNSDENMTDEDTDSGSDSLGVRYDVRADKINTKGPLTHELRVTHSRLRDEQRPLTLELTVTNRSSETVSYGEQRNALGLDARAGGFVLLRPGDEFYDFEDGWWTKTTAIYRTREFRVGTLDPGESETVDRVVVVDDIEQNPSQPPERLRFERSYGAGPAGVDQNEWTNYEWGFELIAADEN
jgi:hypothetical protein